MYRAIMRAFAEAKRHFVVHLRPEDVAKALENDSPCSSDELQAALNQLAEWGNLLAQPDNERATTVEDFYRARYLYQLSRHGEAAETALAVFEQMLGRRGALQTVALHDIRDGLQVVARLAKEPKPDAGRVHAQLRDLSKVFADLAENAQAFMAGLARTLDLRAVDRDAFLAYKQEIIEYLERFVGDLVVLSADIAALIRDLDEPIQPLLAIAATRDAQDLAPDPELDDGGSPKAHKDLPQETSMQEWAGHWAGLRFWFVGSRDRPSQAMVLQSRARKAISQLLEVVVRLNEQRLGRSDRSADFRMLARWFMACENDGDAHRLWRAAFGLAPARHLTVDEETLQQRREQPAASRDSWWSTEPLIVNPRLRATGSYGRKGPPARVKDRAKEKELLARRLATENEEIREARRRLVTGQTTTLSEIADLDESGFRYFLSLLGEALTAGGDGVATIHTVSGDGAVEIEMTPLPGARARIETEIGVFAGNDYRVRFTDLEQRP